VANSDARAAADMILALLKKRSDIEYDSLGRAEIEERMAAPEDREDARLLTAHAQGQAQGAYWSWYEAHVACLHYFGDWPANPADVSP